MDAVMCFLQIKHLFPKYRLVHIILNLKANYLTLTFEKYMDVGLINQVNKYLPGREEQPFKFSVVDINRNTLTMFVWKRAK